MSLSRFSPFPLNCRRLCVMIKRSYCDSQYSSGYADSVSGSDSDSEHTGGLVDNELYHRPTGEELLKMGFDKPDLRNPKFTALCPTISSNPEIIAVRRRIPSSDTIYHVKRKHFLVSGFDATEGDAILDSKCYKDQAKFINTCAKNLEIDEFLGVYRPKKFAMKTEPFGSVESHFDLGKESREYDTIRSAIQDGWLMGRNALYLILIRALEVCDKYKDLLGLPICYPLLPLNVYNTGGTSKRWAGTFSCNYSILEDENLFFVPDKDGLSWIEQRRKYIENSWDAFDEVASKTYVPDLQVNRMRSRNNPFDSDVIMTVKIGEDIASSQTNLVWNQALTGLQYSRSTYALLISFNEAKMIKIEILDDNTIVTSVKNYHFEKAGSELYQSAALVELFGDVVRIIWKKTKSDLE